MEIITNFVYQLLFSVGIVVAFGAIIALCRHAFCKILGGVGAKILSITGIIGTPIHELSHALMCLIFGHKITEMKLYQPNSDDGTMGYVSHSYNPKNLYHQVGNFFIGIAPIICGSGVLFLLLFLLVPDCFHELVDSLQFVELLTIDFFDISTYEGFFDLFWEIILDIFDFTNVGNVFWWIFVVLAIMISSHMELSGADIKGGFKGFLFIAALLLIADIIMYFAYLPALEAVTNFMTVASLTIAGFLSISAVFSISYVLIALAIKGFMKIKR